MELPILQLLPGPLPMDAIRIITQFLRKPHPTALMIKELRFCKHRWGFTITGDPIRCHIVRNDEEVYPPTFGGRLHPHGCKSFQFDQHGEYEEKREGHTMRDWILMGLETEDLEEMGFDIPAASDDEEFWASEWDSTVV